MYLKSLKVTFLFQILPSNLSQQFPFFLLQFFLQIPFLLIFQLADLCFFCFRLFILSQPSFSFKERYSLCFFISVSFRCLCCLFMLVVVSFISSLPSFVDCYVYSTGVVPDDLHFPLSSLLTYVLRFPIFFLPIDHLILTLHFHHGYLLIHLVHFLLVVVYLFSRAFVLFLFRVVVYMLLFQLWLGLVNHLAGTYNL